MVKDEIEEKKVIEFAEENIKNAMESGLPLHKVVIAYGLATHFFALLSADDGRVTIDECMDYAKKSFLTGLHWSALVMEKDALNSYLKTKHH